MALNGQLQSLFDGKQGGFGKPITMTHPLVFDFPDIVLRSVNGNKLQLALGVMAAQSWAAAHYLTFAITVHPWAAFTRLAANHNAAHLQTLQFNLGVQKPTKMTNGITSLHQAVQPAYLLTPTMCLQLIPTLTGSSPCLATQPSCQSLLYRDLPLQILGGFSQILP